MDGFIAEPANAAFIQRRLGANPAPTAPDSPRTFSFDLANGGCGVLTAIHVMDGLLASGRVQLGMVVSSDVHRARDRYRQNTFDPAGAAVLMRRGTAHDGFVSYRFETFPEHASLFGSDLRWSKRAGPRLPWRAKGNHVLSVRHAASFLDRCVDCAADVVGRFLEDLALDPRDLDFLIPSQYPVGFPKSIGERLGIDAAHVVDLTPEGRVFHTAGPVAAFEAISRTEAFAVSRRLMFVTVGAGITVSAALYVRSAEEDVS
jgi:3-oxoacyl-[acyl-carrier-protein] synthase-3